ncbi:TonB family protein [Mucilaginibacter mali]|uniref:TonB family protein n=1 Tax=Mucilaginibacter mali TaxID=2740462 RepID=A0A7D4QHD6_9SPHI|nr:energy transducer TonB [Mucilaginibacter mali]QKJ31872.1 TonB family protein [Mucilaginibacter mali]
MKKHPLIFCALLLALAGFAQTKSVTKDSLNYREKYEVLKANPNVKQGKYSLSVRSSGKILTTGFYKNNLKDGTWHEYNLKDYVIAEGQYTNGRKTGEWKYYGKLWKLMNKFDFDNNQLTFHQPTHDDSVHVYRVLKGRDTIATLMERPPIYLGSDILFRSLLYNLRYPAEAVKKRVSGRVVIGFTIDEKGHVHDYRVVGSLGYGCDEEALRVVKLIPEDWVAGQYKGSNVAVVMNLPVAFTLE